VLADLVFEAHRSSLLALCALLQGVFLLLFPLFLRVPSCADVAGPPNDSAQSLTLWTLQVLGILLSLFSNNKYASALWLLLALAISIPTVLLLIDLDVQYCRASALMDAGLDGTVLSSLSTSLPSSVPRASRGPALRRPRARAAPLRPRSRSTPPPPPHTPHPPQSWSLPCPPLWCCSCLV
jgi:hypothetical protein